MTSPDDLGEKKLSRRRFIKSAGAIAAAGLIGVGLGGQLLKQEPEKAANTRASSAAAPSPLTPSPLYRTTPVSPPWTTAMNPFSIFWITDTQFLSESNPALYRLMTEWIAENWTRFNGKMVIHTGDVVQNGSQQTEWENADAAMSVLLDNGIPYTWCAGNHDNVVEGDPTSGWNGKLWAPAFDPQSVTSRVNALQYTAWVSDYHEAMNTAVSFTANGLNFLIINIEWNAQPDVLTWVGSLLDNPAYSLHRVIIAPHAYIDAYGSLDDARYGTTLNAFTNGLTKLMDAHSSNVFLTLNGHFATECGYNTPAPVNNRNELMFDRQDCTDDPSNPTERGIDMVTSTTKDADKVGGATVTILTFDTRNKITANTFDVHTGTWRSDKYEQYSFTMLSTGGAGSSATNAPLS
jgi:hypothetical protein